MLSDEEKKAMEILEKFTTEHKLFNIKYSDGLEEAIETLLTVYKKEKEKRQKLEYEALEAKEYIKRLKICHSQYEEMTGIDLLLIEKEKNYV